MSKNTQPDLSKPLINEPPQVSPGEPTDTLGPLQHLVGTWTNQNIHGTSTGDPESPYSYNLMVLPQVDPASPAGYILKNLSYYEEITFSAIHGNAGNRGGTGTQVANALLYEQRVFFASGPAKDSLVHFENGTWLFLSDTDQLLGPYGDGDGPDVGNKTVQDSSPPTQPFDIVKQISVPHGNSILAPGTFKELGGSPNIPNSPSVLPVGVNTDQYREKSVGNPNPEFTENPNQPLINAIKVAPATSYIQFDVDTKNGSHPVSNIGFEQQHAKVSRYSSTLWLEAFGGSSEYTQIQYSQTILLEIPIDGKIVTFPHPTTNTVTKKKA